MQTSQTEACVADDRTGFGVGGAEGSEIREQGSNGTSREKEQIVQFIMGPRLDKHRTKEKWEYTENTFWIRAGRLGLGRKDCCAGWPSGIFV
jgi:hypothetical protein